MAVVSGMETACRGGGGGNATIHAENGGKRRCGPDDQHPPNRRKPRPFRPVLLLGLTVLLFLLIVNHYYNIAGAMLQVHG